MPKIDLASIEQTNSTGYPPPFNEAVAGRFARKIGQAIGFTDFGITETTLQPGAWSSQRHWHEGEDELVVILEGEAVLIEEDGETIMRPGDIAAFRKGVANGHHFINRCDHPCRFIAIGRPPTADCHYPDIDLMVDGATLKFTRRDRTPY